MSHSYRALLVAAWVAAGVGALAAASIAQDQPAGPAKLYRWVGPDGKVHYGDDIPPEALNQARQEISKNTGNVLKTVDRPLTAEERAAADAKTEADRQAGLALAKAKENDQILLNSYPTEADLTRAYADRVGSQTGNLKTLRLSLADQQSSLASFLYAASTKELEGKPVDAYLVASIGKLHTQILAQQQAESDALAQLANTRQEATTTLAHYRQLRAALLAAHSSEQATPASPASGSPASPAHD
ncbi:MAG: DUF4124 domain-containing protein [Proteobacteria bacterium]|nr:DUF4124 domain-containing protein [Pseudomonadota bacterium]